MEMMRGIDCSEIGFTVCSKQSIISLSLIISGNQPSTAVIDLLYRPLIGPSPLFTYFAPLADRHYCLRTRDDCSEEQLSCFSS